MQILNFGLFFISRVIAEQGALEVCLSSDSKDESMFQNRFLLFVHSLCG